MKIKLKEIASLIFKLVFIGVCVIMSAIVSVILMKITCKVFPGFRENYLVNNDTPMVSIMFGFVAIAMGVSITMSILKFLLRFNSNKKSKR